MRRYIPILLTLTSIACSKSGNDLTRFYEDGRAKPIVAIASIIDATSLDLPWSLSEELTSLLVKNVAQGGKICVTTKDDLASTDNPFGSDLSWLKREFPEDQFVVFLELVEHEVSATESDKPKAATPFETAMNLTTAIKVRVVDLRRLSPKIVLQELVRNTYFIPKNIIPTNYSVSAWGTNEFPRTPLGLAHQELIQEVALRISEYIQLAKSR